MVKNYLNTYEYNHLGAVGYRDHGPKSYDFHLFQFGSYGEYNPFRITVWTPQRMRHCYVQLATFPIYDLSLIRFIPLGQFRLPKLEPANRLSHKWERSFPANSDCSIDKFISKRSRNLVLDYHPFMHFHMCYSRLLIRSGWRQKARLSLHTVFTLFNERSRNLLRADTKRPGSLTSTALSQLNRVVLEVSNLGMLQQKDRLGVGVVIPSSCFHELVLTSYVLGVVSLILSVVPRAV